MLLREARLRRIHFDEWLRRSRWPEATSLTGLELSELPATATA